MEDKEQKIFLFFLIVLFAFCALFAATKISFFDIWWHLKTGEWIWQHKAIPYVDPFSYTFRGAEWIDFEWLFQFVLYPIYRLGGFEGLIIFKIVVVLLTFVVVFLTCRELDKGKTLLSITLLFVVLLVAQGRFMVRPDIIFLLFLALYHYLLTLYNNEKITTRLLIILLLPIHGLWVNFHGSFLIGIFLVGAFTMGNLIPLALSHHRNLKPVFEDDKLRSLVLLCLLLCLVSLLNPHTYRVFLIPLQTAGAEETLRGIIEWTSMDIRSVGLFVINPTMWFRALFLVGIVSFLINRTNFTRVGNIVIFALFSYMAFKHIRFTGAFAIATVPIIVYNFSQLQWQLNGWRWIRFFPLVIIIAFCVIELGTLMRLEKLGLGVWRSRYPQVTVQFLKEHEVRGRIFNAYGYGGYIIWYLWPNVPVFIDGRTPTVYSEDFFWLYRQALENETVWKRLVDEYDIDIVLIDDKRDNGYRSFVKRLDDDPAWFLVSFDEVSSLYLKDKPKFKGIIQRYQLKYFRPGDVNLEHAISHKSKDYLKNLIQELRGIEAQYPSNFYIYHSLGMAYFLLYEPAQLENAYLYLKKALVIEPDKKFGHVNLGVTLMWLKRYEEAIAEFKETTALYPKAYYYMGICYYETGEFQRAIKFLTKYKEILGDKTTEDVYEYLGLSYLKAFQLQKAVSYFLREKYLEEPLFHTYQNLGIAYFGLRDYENARNYFQEALYLRPDDIKALYNLGVCYENLGRSEEALIFFKRVADFSAQTDEERDLIERAKRKLEQ